MTVFSKIAMIGALSLAVGACTPTVRLHGFAPDPETLETVRAGVDTRGSVRRKVGRPSSTGVFTENGWYYVATTIEHMTYNDPKVVDRRVVAITFDESDVVASVNTYGLEDGRVIDLQTRTTPTAGRGLTILEQLLGNIGIGSLGETLTDN
ncbi:MAG: outer membrane protein assembly factor BamE [Pseudomonadota bacterium]